MKANTKKSYTGILCEYVNIEIKDDVLTYSKIDYNPGLDANANEGAYVDAWDDLLWG